MRARKFYSYLIVLGTIFLTSNFVYAGTFTVTTTADEYDAKCDTHCSLRDAVRMANSAGGDNVIVLPSQSAPYTLSIPGVNDNTNLSGDLDVAGKVTIAGNGAEATVIDGNHLDRVFDIRPWAVVKIQGVTIRNGSSQKSAFSAGGGILNKGELTIIDGNLVDNVSTESGGAILNQGKLKIINSVFTNNAALMGDGGAIAQVGNSLEVSHTTFKGNHAVKGGAINFIQGPTLLDQVTISENKASNQGGGIWTGNTNSVGIKGTTISGNLATAGNDCLGVLIFDGKLNNLGDPRGCVTLGPEKKKSPPPVKVPTIKGGLRGSGIGGPKGRGTKGVVAPKKITIQAPAIKVQTPSVPKGTGIGGSQEKSPKKP